MGEQGHLCLEFCQTPVLLESRAHTSNYTKIGPNICTGVSAGRDHREITD